MCTYCTKYFFLVLFLYIVFKNVSQLVVKSLFSFSLSLYNKSGKVFTNDKICNHFRVTKKRNSMSQNIGSRTQQLSRKKGHYWVPFHLGKISQSRFSTNYMRTWSQIQGRTSGVPHGLHAGLVIPFLSYIQYVEYVHIEISYVLKIQSCSLSQVYFEISSLCMHY